MAAFYRILVLAVLLLPATAAAQEIKVLPLLTETSATASASWWIESVPTPFVTQLMSTSASGLTWSTVEDLSAVSSVLRRPNLSDSNALALASIAGAQFALVGTVSREALTSFGPFDPQGVRTHVSARLLRKTKAGVSSLAVLKLSSVTYGSLGDESLVQNLKDTVATELASGPSADGIKADEPFIVLRGEMDGDALRWAIGRLMAHPDVKEARVAWAVPGAVALELNPDSVESINQLQLAAEQFRAPDAAWTFELVAGEARFGSDLQFVVQKNTSTQ